MADKHYAFLKNDVVHLIAVFQSEDTQLADSVSTDLNYDSYVWLGDAPAPHLYSKYNGTDFIASTLDDLYAVGVSLENEAMRAERIAKEEESKAK